MNQKRKQIYIITLAIPALIALIIWIYWGNSALTVNKIIIKSSKIPQSFSGYRIAQISDLHNTKFGSNNNRLLNKLKETNPDIIVITGDFVDSHHTNINISLDFAKQAVLIAPTYYVAGNHEARILGYNKLEKEIESAGIVVLKNEKIQLKKAKEYITLIGIDDPSFRQNYLISDSKMLIKSILNNLITKDDTFTAVLSHRPELFDAYVESGADLVFTGHAHGGQFRLPFIGGILAPGQGLFPKYDAGLYSKNNTNMIVSRGLGNSTFPFRINNIPEIVVVELQFK